MKDLEEQQREMRERNRRAAVKPEGVTGKVTADDHKPAEPVRASSNKNELDYLKRRVAALESENSDLRLELARLRQVSARPEQSYEAKRREQQHNFFKYSNIRRY